LIAPTASPVVAIGSQAIDQAPLAVKEFAIRTFGENDKLVLVVGIIVLMIPISAFIGWLAFRNRTAATVLIALLGVLGLVAALADPNASIVSILPSLVAIVVGVFALGILADAASTHQLHANAKTADDVAGAGESVITHEGFAPSRRNILLGAAAGGAVISIGGATLANSLINSNGALGRGKLPSPTEAAPALPSGLQPDVKGVTPWLTDAKDFYRVDTAITIPRINANTWKLTIDGMVNKKFTMTYKELLAMPMVERHITLACVSNEVGGPYISNGKWQGVLLKDILDKAGVKSGADQLFSTSSNGWTASTTLADVLDGRDAMIAVGLNGEALPLERGFPARMLVPGLYGYVSATKWLTKLEVTTFAKAQSYWTERKWADKGPIFTESRVDVPAPLSTVSSGKVSFAGIAWAQNRGISKVEIRLDGGDWVTTTLAADGGKDTWREWSAQVDLKSGSHGVEVRATDMTGAVQTEARADPFPKGATGWQLIRFTCS
ncbi:MAG: molybdopterin-dependent oxidoreductase, partial [Antricoccus sp.]